MEKKAYFQLSGPAGAIATVDVLDPKITGFPKKDISEVAFTPFFPGSPYLEKDVAKHWGHPCFGSGSFMIKKNDGTAVIVSPIFFADKNPLKSHFSGSEHWNIEFWHYKAGECPRRVQEISPGSGIHQLRKSGYLEIVASGTDFPTFKYQIKWAP